MRILLHAIGGPGLGSSAPGGPGRALSVGRGVLAHLRVRDDDALAPVHFEVDCTEAGCRLRDVSGGAGVKVNGQPVRSADLKVGDVIIAGNSTFEVRALAGPIRSVTATLVASPSPTATLVAPPSPVPPLVAPPPPPAAPAAGRPVLEVLRGQDEPLYAILNAARDPQVYTALVNCKEKHQSLYEVPMAEQLAHVAPYLVQLQPGNGLLEPLLQSSWGNSWGVFLTSREPFDAVRKHLRHVLTGRLVDGKQVYFLFYDPRVLRHFLPSCNDEEWAQFFGPISAYLMEADPPTALLKMTARAAPEKTTTIPVVPPG